MEIIYISVTTLSLALSLLCLRAYKKLHTKTSGEIEALKLKNELLQQKVFKEKHSAAATISNLFLESILGTSALNKIPLEQKINDVIKYLGLKYEEKEATIELKKIKLEKAKK